MRRSSVSSTCISLRPSAAWVAPSNRRATTHPSAETATLLAPDGSSRELDAGRRAPGVHSLSWEPRSAPAGRWTFRVTAADDLGRVSSAARRFAVDNTLGFPSGGSLLRGHVVRVAARNALGAVDLRQPLSGRRH